MYKRQVTVEGRGAVDLTAKEFDLLAMLMRNQGRVFSRETLLLSLIHICTGIGMSMAANKVHGIRAAAVSDCFTAKATRMHNDANVLCLGERTVGPGLAAMIADFFLDTDFEGGRHQTRVDMMMALEK